MMMPAAVAALTVGFASVMAVTPNVVCFAIVTAVFGFACGVGISIPVIALNFRIPNELRGLSMGLYVVLFAIAGAVSAPLVAAVSQSIGGDAMIGRAMAIVGIPLGLMAAACFWGASRTDLADCPRPRVLNATAE
jgi:MFS family permease